MHSRILGLDVGGANIKAALADGTAILVPFALWRQPAELGAAIARLLLRFQRSMDCALTMTAELWRLF